MPKDDAIEQIIDWIDEHAEPGDYVKSKHIAEHTDSESSLVGRYVEEAFQKHGEYKVEHWGQTEPKLWLIKESDGDGFTGTKEMLNTKQQRLTTLDKKGAFTVIASLSRNRPRTPKSLSEDHDNINTEMVMALANSLTSLGLVKWESNKLRLTDQGKSLSTEIHSVLELDDQ